MNNLRILRIQNAKFPGYHFYMNTNIWSDFQICISVPLKQPIYYKLRPKIIANYGSFIAGHDNRNYKLLQNYYKLQQKVITNSRLKFIRNYCKKLWQITAAVIFVKFKIITNNVKFYYILRQLLVLLQITANFITNYGRNYKLRRYYKLRRNSLNLFFVLC